MYQLNDLEIELVEAFMKNETQREAVKKVLLAGVYHNGVIKEGVKHDPIVNWALGLALNANSDQVSNEQLGANLRAVAEGIRIVQLAWDKLSTIKKPEQEKNKKNPAR